MGSLFCALTGGGDGNDREASLEDLFMFWTGTTTVPPGGFRVSNTPIQPSIAFFTKDCPGRLPSSSTCGLVLYLPRGTTDPLAFHGEVIRGIKMSGGFGRV